MISFSKHIQSFYSYTSKKPLLFVLGILLANLVLKFLYVDHSGFHLDEAWHTFFSQKSFSEILVHASEDPNPPLYNLLIGLWLRIFDVSAFSIRAFSVVVSSIISVALFFFAKRHVNIQTAIWGSLIFSVSNLQYYYSHDARVYALVGLLCVASSFYFLNLLKQPSLKQLILYTFFSSLLLYTHTIPILLLSAHFLVGIVFIRKFMKGFWMMTIGQVVSVFLFALWILNSPYYQREVSTWIEPPGWTEIYPMLVAYLNSEVMLFAFVLVLIGFVVMLFARKRWGKASQNQKIAFVFLLCWAVLPICEMLVFSHTIISIFEWRYTLFATLGIYLLFAFLISQLPIKNIGQLILGLVIVVHSTFYLKMDHGKNVDWKTMAKYATERKDDKTLVLIAPYFQYVAFTFYYNLEYFKDYDNTAKLLEGENIHACPDFNYLSNINERDYEKIMLLATDNNEVVESYRSYLSEKYGLIDSIQRGGTLGWTFDASLEDNQSFFLDFDNYHAGKNVQTIVESSVAKSGSMVSQTDTINRYSSGFRRDVAIIDPCDSIRVNAWCYADGESFSGATLVTSFSSPDSTYSWDAAKLKDSISDSGWWRLSITVPFIPAISNKDQFITYVWNESNKTILVDDMSIELIKSE